MPLPARAYWLGARPYDAVHSWMERLVLDRHAGRIGDVLLLLEHRPVVTLGRAAKRENILLTPEALRARGIDLFETGRGGDVTYHGPGQLVAYPIIDLKPDRCDVRRYVATLANVMSDIARSYGVEAGIVDGKIGVWVDRTSPAAWPGEKTARDLAKLGAIGVRISRWITMHGFAFNGTTALDGFQVIVPCGISEYGVTSIAELTRARPSAREMAEAAMPSFAERLGFRCGLADASGVELADIAL